MKVILGGPGAGKTERLLQTVEHELDAGVEPERIAFVSFTREAANEAKRRAADRFGFDPKRLVWFRTIHSLAFRRLGLRREEVLQRSHLKELGELLGTQFKFQNLQDGPASTLTEGDQCLFIDQYARATGQSVEEAYHHLLPSVPWYTLDRFERTLREYKADCGLLDFSDMLTQFLEAGEPLDVDVAVVDEAQDLTRVQWQVIDLAFSRAKRLYAAGDDDQAIYRWAGADVQRFLSLTDQPEVLPSSHRLPREVFNLAAGVARRIQHRYAKRWDSAGHSGGVHWHAEPEHVDVRDGSWLLLARNSYMLSRLAALCEEQGVLYRRQGQPSARTEEVTAIRAWETLRGGKSIGKAYLTPLYQALRLPEPELPHDGPYTAAELQLDTSSIWHDALVNIPVRRREYYLACLRRGEDLLKEPRVRVENIHGVKGAEADNVLMLTDISRRTDLAYRHDPDSEHRVLYVGLTRARENLHLIRRQGDKHFFI